MKNDELTDLLKSISDSMRPILEAQARMQESFRPMIESLDSMRPMIASVLKQQQDFLDSVKRIEKHTSDTREVMLKSGWWLTPSLMEVPALWIDEAVDKFQNGNKKAIFDLYRKVYQNDNCKNLGTLVSKWKKNPLLNSWSAHLDDALDAHKQKKYTLSVPVLLLIAEGVAGEFCKKNGIKVNESSGKDKIEKSTRDHYQKSDHILLSYLDLLEGALSNTVYENTTKLKSSLKKNILNRHAVLHGIKKNYGSMKTSLQSFMLIDMLSELK